MLLNIVKKTWFFFIIVGTVAMVGFFIDQGSVTPTPSIVTQQTQMIGSYEFTYYVLDIPKYLNNLKSVFTGDTFFASIPQWPQEINYYEGSNLGELLKNTVNTLIYGLDVIIFLLNLTLLTPIKLILYPEALLFTILGVDTTSAKWLEMINILTNINIPIIPYVPYA